MKPKQIISIVLFAVAIGLLIWWFANGHHPWTTTQSMIEVKTTDELFGTTVTTQKWVKEFTPGLEFVGPTAAALAAIGAWLLFRGRKNARS